MNEEKKLITFSKAAELRNTSLPAIYDLVKRKKLTVIMEKGKKYLSKVEVENYEKGQGGRPVKTNFDDYQKKQWETLILKIQNPENYYTTFFGYGLLLRNVWRHLNKEKTQDSIFEALNRYRDKTFRRNKRLFRERFSGYNKVFRLTVVLNQKIIVERVYENTKIQAFFEYFMHSSLILTEDENIIEKAFAGFISEYFNDFSDLWKKLESLKEKNISVESANLSQNNQTSLENDSLFQEAVLELSVKKGRPSSFVDKQGNIKGLSPIQEKAIKMWNKGKNGIEIFAALLPIKNYKKKEKYNLAKRNRDIRALVNGVWYHVKKNPSYFTRPFDKSLFNQKLNAKKK